jgi:hypothetical protein
MENHTHGIDGNVIISEPSPDEAQLEAVETVSSAEVEIARIQSDRDIALAKIAAKTVEPDLEAELAAAQAELETLRAIVNPPTPEPVDQAPVVVVADGDGQGDEDDEEPSLESPENVPAEPAAHKSSHSMSQGWFG